MTKRFGASLTNAEFSFAREVQRAGLASISQATKAFERGDTERIRAWKQALAVNKTPPVSTNEAQYAEDSTPRIIEALTAFNNDDATEEERRVLLNTLIHLAQTPKRPSA